jgi:hypothetical protein
MITLYTFALAQCTAMHTSCYCNSNIGSTQPSIVLATQALHIDVIAVTTTSIQHTKVP